MDQELMSAIKSTLESCKSCLEALESCVDKKEEKPISDTETKVVIFKCNTSHTVDITERSIDSIYDTYRKEGNGLLEIDVIDLLFEHEGAAAVIIVYPYNPALIKYNPMFQKLQAGVQVGVRANISTIWRSVKYHVLEDVKNDVIRVLKLVQESPSWAMDCNGVGVLASMAESGEVCITVGNDPHVYYAKAGGDLVKALGINSDRIRPLWL